MTTEPKANLVPELACRDASDSKKFYVEILGFRVLYERSEHGFHYLERQGAEIMIEQLSDTSWITDTLEPPFGRGLHFQIETTDLTALYETCKTNGVKIFREWEEAWYRAGDHYVGQSQFIVCDPDGYMLRFIEDLGTRVEPPESGRVVS
ncbi:MAG: catechol 2,3-dioxygenase-like lactoylglutathione lyase family enzyme [Paracoccaceae bacterium]